MTRLALGLLVFVGSVTSQCSRQTLQQATDQYLATVVSGANELPFSDAATYSENFNITDFKTGIHFKPIRVASNRTLLDTTACATYTELIAPDNTPPYVIGTQIRYTGNKVTKMEVLFSTTGDWFFDAKATLKWASQEDRSIIPEAKRDARSVIQAAADAYLDSFDKPGNVPSMSPCERLEGSFHVAPDCLRGIRSNGGKMLNKRYVIDEAVGTVDVFMNFRESAPDSHEFRVEGGKIRYVHTITVTKGKSLAPPSSSPK
jgi:hypothetical protein